MDVRITRTRRDARVALSGEIDFSCAPALEAALHGEIGRAAAAGGTVLIDAAAVTFIDMEAVTVLFRATERLSATRVILASPSRIVRRVIALAEDILPPPVGLGQRRSA
jgi:anti-anti-sigma factor